MPVIIVIVVLAVAAVCAAAFFAVRAYKHRRFAEQLDNATTIRCTMRS